MRKLFTFITILAFSLIFMSSTPTVYFIGDSTMADYDPAVYPNQRGWGQMFRNFIEGDINYVNGARNGRSSRSFYTGSDSLWAGIRTKLKAGDYVFIQFAHNDEKLDGLSDPATTGGIATAPWSDYQEYLRKYVNDTRNAGATPVLITPIIRAYFSGNSITEKGKHNLGTDDSTLNYVRAMKAVAREMTTPLIDHTTLTCNLAESMGATDASATIYVTSDKTHLNPTGATLYAQLAVQEMLNQNILAGFLNASPNLIITPGALDFGNSYITTFSSSKLNISGLSLTPASGNVTVNAPDGFFVGLSSTGTFSGSLQIPYSGGNLNATDLFVRFQPAEEKEYADSLSIMYGETIKKVSVKGIGLSMSSGVDATVNFPLVSNATPVVTGPVICLDQSWSEMYVKNYAAIATWPSEVTATNVQRNSISATANNAIDAWPAGEIDINTSRYIQFAVKPNAGTKLTVDSVGLYAGAAGGGGLKYRVLYSKNADFSNPVTLEDKTTNTSNTMDILSYKPMTQVTDAEGFYLRFYPWYNGAVSLKYLCLSNLTIKARVSTVSGISDLNAETVSVYPNPSTGIYNFQSSGNFNTIEVYNTSGILVKSQNLDANNKTIDLTGCTTGIYLARIISEKNTLSLIMVKK
jgi:lysophospholipase L1-like esterase